MARFVANIHRVATLILFQGFSISKGLITFAVRYMKILQICKKFPYPPFDGESIAILQLSRGLAQRGNSVRILAMNTPKHHYSPARCPDDLKKMLDIHAVDVDTRVKLLPAFLNLFSNESYNIQRFYSRNFGREIIRHIRDFKPDVIQMEGIYLASYLSTIRKETDVPLVLRSHNREYRIWEGLARHERNPLKRRYFTLLATRLQFYEQATWSRFDGIASISPADSEEIRLNSPGVPVLDLPAGLDLDLYPYREPVEIPHDMFIFGALDWMPNLEGLQWFLDYVWPVVHKALPGVPLVVAGRNAPAHFLKRRIPDMSYLGEVPDARQFYLDHDLCLIPLQSGSGMRIKALEALALGKTIVATSKAVEGIGLEPGKHFLLADKPKDFARAIIECFNDVDLYRKTGRQGAAFVREKYRIDRLAEKMEKFLENLLH